MTLRFAPRLLSKLFIVSFTFGCAPPEPASETLITSDGAAGLSTGADWGSDSGPADASSTTGDDDPGIRECFATCHAVRQDCGQPGQKCAPLACGQPGGREFTPTCIAARGNLRVDQLCDVDHSDLGDACAAGLLCVDDGNWFGGPRGTCQPFCDHYATPGMPGSCDALGRPGQACISLYGNNAVPLCVPRCHPAGEACERGRRCQPMALHDPDSWLCGPDWPHCDAIGCPPYRENELCSTLNSCEPGLVCDDIALGERCDPGTCKGTECTRCCRVACDLGGSDPDRDCPSGMRCRQVEAPDLPARDTVGVCVEGTN